MIVVTDDHDDDPSTEPQPVSSTPNQHDTNDISRNNSIFSRCVHSNTNTNGDGGVDIDDEDDDEDDDNDGSRRTGNSDDVSANPLDDTFDRLLLLVVPLDNVTDDDDDEDDDDISVVVSTSSLASLASFL